MSDRATHSYNSRASTPDSIERRCPGCAEEVYKKQLTGKKQAVILAMIKIAESEGGTSECMRMSIPRIAAWSKLCKKTVQRELWGDHRKHPGQARPKREKGKPDKECPFCPDSLITSRVLQQLAPAKWKEHRPARYRLNLEILDDSDVVRKYLDQENLFPTTEQRPTVAAPQRPTVASPPSVPRSHPSVPRSLAPSVPRSHPSVPRSLAPSVPRSHDLNLDDDREPLGVEIDSESQANRESVPISSSSSSDDNVTRVLRAFAQSPVTTGKATFRDRATARKLLTRFTPEQIEYGIVLAAVRRSTSRLTQPVQTLTYFENAIEEAAATTAESSGQPSRDQVREIASLYPKIDDPSHLTPEISKAIGNAILRHGRDAVWIGTKGMAEKVANWPRPELQFIPSAEHYFGESQYRKNPQFWDKSQNPQQTRHERTAQEYSNVREATRGILRREP